MRTIFLAALVCLLSASASAQKFNPNLSFLQGQKAINVVFDYQGLTIDGDSEADFVKEQMEDEKEEDRETWKSNWYGKWRESYIQAFIYAANEETGDKMNFRENKDAEYAVVVKVKDIDPGNFAGPFSNPAKIKATISIVKTSDNSVVSQTEFKDIYTPVGIAPLIEVRIAAGFSELGETLAEIIVKAIK